MASSDDELPPYQVDVLLSHPSVVVSRIHLAPGAETPRHAHRHDYVVHPRAACTLQKTTFRGDQVVSQETLTHVPDRPYYVARSAEGTAFTLKNTGRTPMLLFKVQVIARQ